MNDFTILHLSDLHINGTGKGLTPLLKNLLSDIKEELKPVDNVILVITGDIIDKANYCLFRTVKGCVGGKAERRIYCTRKP